METQLGDFKQSFEDFRKETKDRHGEFVKTIEKQGDRIVKMEVWRGLVTGGLILAAWVIARMT